MHQLFDLNSKNKEELYNILSLIKIKYNSKNKLPDDTYKSLKSAIKLEKEIENTTKAIIEEIDSEKLNGLNSKELELVLGSVRNSNEKQIKYYHIKHIQV